MPEAGCHQRKRGPFRFVPDTWDDSKGLQLVYMSRGRSLNARRLFCVVTWICTNTMLRARRGKIAKRKSCAFRLSEVVYFGSVHETTTLVKICVLLQLLVTRQDFNLEQQTDGSRQSSHQKDSQNLETDQTVRCVTQAK